MISFVSQTLVVGLGLSVLILSLWGLGYPAKLIGLVSAVLDKSWGVAFGVIIRLLLGAALIVAAADSAFPVVFRALGWIIVASAVVLAVMGRKNIRRLIDWFARRRSAVIRSWLLFGVGFGAFLIYGFVLAAADGG